MMLKYKDIISTSVLNFRVLLREHVAKSVDRFWPRNKEHEVYGPHDDDDNIVETTIDGNTTKI